MDNLSLLLFANKELLNIIIFSLLIIIILYFSLRKIVKKHLFIVILTAVYGFLTFYNLGSMQGASSFYEVTKPNSTVILEIDDEENYFDKIYATSLEGISNGNNRYQIYFHDIVIEGSNDLENFDYITTLSDEEFGKLSVYECPMSYSYKYIRLSFPSINSVINEIGFYDSINQEFKDLKVIQADDTTYDPNNLIDEQAALVADFDYQNETYFDEIYHVRNAYEIANDLPLYTAVHPLLGTRFIALGIEIFGMNPFGYRFFGALVSTLLVPLLYILTYNLFHKIRWANIAASLFCLDFMHYTTGRIATLEPFSLLWIILMYIFMVKFMNINYLKNLKKAIFYLFLSGLMMAFAWATKWTGIYASIGLAIIFFYQLYVVLRNTKDKHKIKKTIIILLSCIIFFVIVPVIVYFLTFQGIYIYDILPTNITEAIRQLFDYTEYMFTYHSGLESTHPYSSKWYMWLFDIRPIWYYVNYLGENIQTISCFNNPIISIVGFLTILYTIYKGFKNKDKVAIIISMGYLSSLIPWVFISRTTFAYHYYPCIPFLILGIIYFFANNKKEKLLKAFLIVTTIIFVIYLPVISGFMTYDFFVSYILRILPSWYFG